MKDVQQAINAQMNDVAPDLNRDSLSERSSPIYRRQSKYNCLTFTNISCGEWFFCIFRSNFTRFLREKDITYSEISD